MNASHIRFGLGVWQVQKSLWDAEHSERTLARASASFNTIYLEKENNKRKEKKRKKTKQN